MLSAGRSLRVTAGGDALGWSIMEMADAAHCVRKPSSREEDEEEALEAADSAAVRAAVEEPSKEPLDETKFCEKNHAIEMDENKNLTHNNVYGMTPNNF